MLPTVFSSALVTTLCIVVYASFFLVTMKLNTDSLITTTAVRHRSLVSNRTELAYDNNITPYRT